MDGKVIYGNIVGGVSRMRPAKNGFAGGMEDLLGVGTGEVRGERNIEGEVDGGVGGGRRT